jgi:hypothetical protein
VCCDALASPGPHAPTLSHIIKYLLSFDLVMRAAQHSSRVQCQAASLFFTFFSISLDAHALFFSLGIPVLLSGVVLSNARVVLRNVQQNAWFAPRIHCQSLFVSRILIQSFRLLG